MKIHLNKTSLFVFSLSLSLLLHILMFFALRMFSTYHFAVPVDTLQTVMVEVARTNNISPASTIKAVQVDDTKETREQTHERTTETKPETTPETTPETPQSMIQAPDNINSHVNIRTPLENSPLGHTVHEETEPVIPPVISPQNKRKTSDTIIVPPLRTASEFLASSNEKLSYLISIAGIPVGNAELEAKNQNNELKITLRVNSNPAMAVIYPVDDLIETRHIAGNFIITKIRQQEGDFRSDIGFTLFLRDKSVFWMDRIRNRYSRETVPNNEVLDTLSGFYFIRNKELQVGKNETLHIYDSEKYQTVAIEVLRREKILLPNMSRLDTLVVHPVLKSNETSSRTKDMIIWLTNDNKKVPVRFEISVPFGRITAELVSAESESF